MFYALLGFFFGSYTWIRANSRTLFLSLNWVLDRGSDWPNTLINVWHLLIEIDQ